jgi:hypothetical protein
MLAEMLTGEEPTLGVPNVDVVPYHYRAYVERCCARDPGGRYADAGAALRELPAAKS